MDDLQGMSEKTRGCIAQADVLRAKGFETPQEFARFAALMFEAGYAQASADLLAELQSHGPSSVVQ